MTFALAAASVDVGARVAAELLLAAAAPEREASVRLDALLAAMTADGRRYRAGIVSLTIAALGLLGIPLAMGVDGGIWPPPPPAYLDDDGARDWKRKALRDMVVRVVVGLAVKLYLVTVTSAGPDAILIVMPWRWNELLYTMQRVVFAVVVFTAYCTFVSKSVNPVMCLLKFEVRLEDAVSKLRAQ